MVIVLAHFKGTREVERVSIISKPHGGQGAGLTWLGSQQNASS